MIYEELEPITKGQAEKDLRSPFSYQKAAEALIRVGLFETDWSWAESFCLCGLRDERSEVQRAAATALGHLARRHKSLGDGAFQLLIDLKDDPVIGGTVEDALEDVRLFAFRENA